MTDSAKMLPGLATLEAARAAARAANARRGLQRIGRDARRAALDLLRVADVLCVVGSGLLADLAYRSLQGGHYESGYTPIALAAGALTPLVFAYQGAYDRGPRGARRRLIATGFKSAATLFVSLAMLAVLTKLSGGLSRLWYGLWFVFCVAGVVGLRLALRTTQARLERAGVLRETVAVVGATALARFVIDHLRSQPRPVEVLGVFEDRRSARQTEAVRIDGSIDDLIDLGKSREIDRVILALPWSADARIRTILTRLMALSVDVSVCPDEAALAMLRLPVDELGGLPTLRVAERPLGLWRLVAKRAEDLVLGWLLLLAAAPVMLAVALLVRLDSPGPALFRQRRHGYNNREITVLKFRTMRVAQADDSGARQTARDDDRITRIGGVLRKLSLDELPQLINVVLGDMSLVGPRPHPVGMRTENLLGEDIIETYAHRHRVKPGMTGWAQVHGFRGATADVEALMRRVEYDLDYIARCSVALDLRILMMTPFSLISTKNAF